jgi:hypothetical protein
MTRYLHKIIIVLICTVLASNLLKAEIIPLFNPAQKFQTNALYINLQGFVANDSMSIKKFMDNWEDKKFYTPYSGDNHAIGMARVDLGTTVSDYYVGYFYNNNLQSTYTKGFVDFYNLLRHKTKVKTSHYYNLKLELDGVEEHGITLAKSIPFYENEEHQLIMGLSVYLSYATRLQDRTLSGYARVNPDNTYDMAFDSDYYYSNQLLKSLFTGRRKVSQEHGYGYGFHYALSYENKKYHYSIQFIANDILARSRWSHAPYSSIRATSNNQVIDDKGYIKYNPTVSGKETYRKHTYTVSPKYHLSIKKRFIDLVNISVGVEHVGDITIPYGSISKKFEGIGEVSLFYETEFKGKGISIEGEHYKLSVMTESFTKTSSFAFSASMHFNF